MKNNSDKKIYFYAVMACLALLAASLLLSYSIAAGNQNEEIAVMSVAPQTFGYVSFVLEDGDSGKPLGDVYAVVLETDKTYTTSKNGNTPKITVPIISDNRFENIYAKDWGEICVVFYKDGYAPYALFYLQVEENIHREKIKILMFESEAINSERAISIIEGPKREWVDSIVEKYTPGRKIIP